MVIRPCYHKSSTKKNYKMNYFSWVRSCNNVSFNRRNVHIIFVIIHNLNSESQECFSSFPRSNAKIPPLPKSRPHLINESELAPSPLLGILSSLLVLENSLCLRTFALALPSPWKTLAQDFVHG